METHQRDTRLFTVREVRLGVSRHHVTHRECRTDRAFYLRRRHRLALDRPCGTHRRTAVQRDSMGMNRHRDLLLARGCKDRVQLLAARRVVRTHIDLPENRTAFIRRIGGRSVNGLVQRDLQVRRRSQSHRTACRLQTVTRQQELFVQLHAAVGLADLNSRRVGGDVRRDRDILR